MERGMNIHGLQSLRKENGEELKRLEVYPCKQCRTQLTVGIAFLSHTAAMAHISAGSDCKGGLQSTATGMLCCVVKKWWRRSAGPSLRLSFRTVHSMGVLEARSNQILRMFGLRLVSLSREGF